MAGAGAARWLHALAALDRTRSEAYQRGRPRLLHQVYVPGSPMARRDRAVLIGYRDRGVHLTGVRLQVQALRVVRSDAAEVTVRVVERLAPTTAVLPGGARVRLPGDGLTRRVLHLVRTPPSWRLAGARRVGG